MTVLRSPKQASTRIWRERLHGGVELLATIGSWGDTLDDADVLAHLRSWNERGTIFGEVIARLD